MKILVACEESQVVTKELRKLGHEAYSCDIQECSGGHPEWHIQDDVLKHINPSRQWIPGGDWFGMKFRTLDGTLHINVNKWDMIIAFPPCTYLSFAGNRHLGQPGRMEKREAARQFFMEFVNADCPRVVIENPVGYMNSCYRKPDQIIHPYMFGDPYIKRTCLWIKGLPLLEPDYLIERP